MLLCNLRHPMHAVLFSVFLRLISPALLTEWFVRDNGYSPDNSIVTRQSYGNFVYSLLLYIASVLMGIKRER